MNPSKLFLLVFGLIGCISVGHGAAANEPSRSPAGKGGLDGGGGFVTACGEEPDGVMRDPAYRAMLVDYIEGENNTELHLTVDLGAPSDSVDAKIEKVLKRLERVNPTRANRYRQWYKTFEQETDTSGIPYSRGDLGSGSLPEKCGPPELVINQGSSKLPGQKRYYRREATFRKLSNDTKAGLILHELIYREVIGKVQSSEGVRFFNALIASKEFEKMPALTVLGYAETIQLPDFDLPGVGNVGLNADISMLPMRNAGPKHFALLSPVKAKFSFGTVDAKLCDSYPNRITTNESGKINGLAACSQSDFDFDTLKVSPFAVGTRNLVIISEEKNIVFINFNNGAKVQLNEHSVMYCGMEMTIDRIARQFTCNLISEDGKIFKSGDGKVFSY